MIIGIIKELSDYEQRVAATPESVAEFTAAGFKCLIEHNAGTAAGFADADYIKAGAAVAENAKAVAGNCDILPKIVAPLPSEWGAIKKNCVIIADFRDFLPEQLPPESRITCFALEKIPRISRAQNMDILSSQDNLAGYKAALLAANISKKDIPMMITAAGTLAAAKVMVVGIGVAGLQAIATAKRLGASVFASDIRPETKEQAESLGARFVDNADLSAKLPAMDIIITAAGSPPKAPALFDSHLLRRLNANCVVIDISGNFHDMDSPQTLSDNGRTLVCYRKAAALLAHSASRLFAENVFNFISLLYPQAADTDFNFADDIIAQTCICYRGQLRKDEKNA